MKINVDLTKILFLILIISSCGMPKDLQKVVDNNPKEMIVLPIDYCNLFPTMSFEKWDSDYDSYNRFLTNNIMRTQMGMSFVHNGVHTWWCMPSAQTHVQLDTLTMINDHAKIVGNWRITCNRKVTYTDSAVYADKKFYRDSKLLNDDKDDDVFLSFTPEKFNMYLKEKGKNKFKKLSSKNYQIESHRFLMLYGLSKSAASISFIGIDKNDQLIINNYSVTERKLKGVYIVYEAIMNQLVFKRMPN